MPSPKLIKTNLTEANPLRSAAGNGAVLALPKQPRNRALDFTKGMLVLLMVVYHWLNYFHPFTVDVFRYLRFLTPSFIFITGFLISNVYLSKYKISDPRLPRRLMQRGLKLLAVFLVLNSSLAWLFPNNGRIDFDVTSLRGFTATFLTGNVVNAETGKAAAFPVLVPISYLLLMGAGLVRASRYYSRAFELTCALLMISVFVIRQNGLQNSHLELLALGSLGVVCGYIPIEKINAIMKYDYVAAVLYLGYLAAITIWDVIYVLQIFGVCLTLFLIYALGVRRGDSGLLERHTITLGEYSLFGYIAQIGIVFALSKIFLHVGHGTVPLLVSFVAAFAFTMSSVEALDKTRKKARTADRLYRIVFA